MTKFYTGVGSRTTPGWRADGNLTSICAQMTSVAWEMAERGYVLRSGRADGADLSFELGADMAGGAKEIYVPWYKFNIQSATAVGVKRLEEHVVTPEAYEIAKEFVPHWKNCNQFAKAFHARNVHQVLGHDLKTPSSCVLYWSPDGKMVGGTATALRIADAYKIPKILIKE